MGVGIQVLDQLEEKTIDRMAENGDAELDVVIAQNSAVGWDVRTLGDPHQFKPQHIAIKRDGSLHVAYGEAMMVAAFQAGRRDEAAQIHERLAPLIKALFLETNPIPLKTAMGLLGWCSPDLRLPLCAMSEANVARLRQALTAYGLLKEGKANSGRVPSAPSVSGTAR